VAGIFELWPLAWAKYPSVRHRALCCRKGSANANRMPSLAAVRRRTMHSWRTPIDEVSVCLVQCEAYENARLLTAVLQIVRKAALNFPAWIAAKRRAIVQLFTVCTCWATADLTLPQVVV
jgi:hypothetical protein